MTTETTLQEGSVQKEAPQPQSVPPLLHLPPPAYRVSQQVINMTDTKGANDGMQALMMQAMAHRLEVPPYGQYGPSKGGQDVIKTVRTHLKVLSHEAKTNPKLLRKVTRILALADTSILANELVSAGVDRFNIARNVISLSFANHTEGKSLVGAPHEGPDSDILVVKAQEAIDSLSQELVEGAGTTTVEKIMRDTPDAILIAMMYLMSLEGAYAMPEPIPLDEGEGGYYYELLYLLNVASRTFARLEGPPQWYSSGAHFHRSLFSSMLVLMRDSHMRFLMPNLARDVITSMGELTGIGDYGHLFYFANHYLAQEAEVARNLVRGVASLGVPQVPQTYNDDIDMAVFETNAKGWWGIAETFFSHNDVRKQLDALAQKYQLTYATQDKAPPQYRYRFSNAYVYAELYNQLVTRHSEDGDVVALRARLSEAVHTTPDMSRMRLVVGENHWEKVYGMVSLLHGASLLLVETTSEGKTSAKYLDLPETSDLALQQINSFVEDKSREGSHPFAAVCVRDTSDFSLNGAHIPYEILIVPSSVAKVGWESTGVYKDLDPLVHQ